MRRQHNGDFVRQISEAIQKERALGAGNHRRGVSTDRLQAAKIGAAIGHELCCKGFGVQRGDCIHVQWPGVLRNRLLRRNVYEFQPIEIQNACVRGQSLRGCQWQLREPVELQPSRMAGQRSGGETRQLFDLVESQRPVVPG